MPNPPGSLEFEDIATPSLVAKAVMDYTDHIMLVGAGAKKFALEMGFKEQNLLTEKSRRDWLRWKACLNPADSWLDTPGNSAPPPRTAGIPFDDPLHVKFTTGTINMNAVNAGGDISSVTTTSGLSWKLPGRVGDSPIIGAGEYCDNTVGAAGSIGRGEANIKVCGAFLTVEFMRQGMSPDQACMKTIDSARRASRNSCRERPTSEGCSIRTDGRYSICNSRLYRKTGASVRQALMRALSTRLLIRAERDSLRCRSSSADRKGRRCLRSAAAELEGADQLRDPRRCVGQRVRDRREVGDAPALFLVRNRYIVHRA